MGPREIVKRNLLVAAFVWAALTALTFMLLISGETGWAGFLLFLLTWWVPAALWWTWRAAQTAWRGEPERPEDLAEPLRVVYGVTVVSLLLGVAAYALLTLPIRW